LTVKEKEEMGQTSEPDPAEEGEHSAEMIEIFSQKVEQGVTTALEVVAEEEHADKMLTPWDMELEMLEDWLNHPEPIDDCHEQTVMQMLAEENSEEWLNIFIQEAEKTATLELAAAEEEKEDNMCFVDLYQEFEALERRVKVQSFHIQQVKLEVDEGGF